MKKMYLVAKQRPCRDEDERGLRYGGLQYDSNCRFNSAIYIVHTFQKFGVGTIFFMIIKAGFILSNIVKTLIL